MWVTMNFWFGGRIFEEFFRVLLREENYDFCALKWEGKWGEKRKENHNKMRGENGALARARTRIPCKVALFAFTTFTKLRVRGSK